MHGSPDGVSSRRLPMLSTFLNVVACFSQTSGDSIEKITVFLFCDNGALPSRLVP
jgi:hypothetical protein